MAKVVPLTVKNAEIKTAAVEIKALKIGGKQVTMAVVRQIQRERLIDAEDAAEIRELFPMPLSKGLAALKVATNREAAWQRNYTNSHTAICSLPQLFIAT